jgi:LEA14-like dessication related protein
MGFEVALIIAGAAGLYFWNLQRAASNLTFVPGNITSFSLNGISPVVYVDLIVQNTNNVSFTINSLSGSVLTDSSNIGNISNFTPVLVPGNSQGVIPLTLVLQPIGIVSEIISIITGGVGSKTLRIKGTVNANGIQSPFDVPYKVGV